MGWTPGSQCWAEFLTSPVTLGKDPPPPFWVSLSSSLNKGGEVTLYKIPSSCKIQHFCNSVHWLIHALLSTAVRLTKIPLATCSTATQASFCRPPQSVVTTEINPNAPKDVNGSWVLLHLWSQQCEMYNKIVYRSFVDTWLKKKKSLLLNIKRPICLVLNQICLESVAVETPVSFMTVGCLHWHMRWRETRVFYRDILYSTGGAGGGRGKLPLALTRQWTHHPAWPRNRNWTLNIAHQPLLHDHLRLRLSCSQESQNRGCLFNV